MSYAKRQFEDSTEYMEFLSQAEREHDATGENVPFAGEGTCDCQQHDYNDGCFTACNSDEVVREVPVGDILALMPVHRESWVTADKIATQKQKGINFYRIGAYAIVIGIAVIAALIIVYYK